MGNYGVWKVLGCDCVGNVDWFFGDKDVVVVLGWGNGIVVDLFVFFGEEVDVFDIKCDFVFGFG